MHRRSVTTLSMARTSRKRTPTRTARWHGVFIRKPQKTLPSGRDFYQPAESRLLRFFSSREPNFSRSFFESVYVSCMINNSRHFGDLIGRLWWREGGRSSSSNFFPFILILVPFSLESQTVRGNTKNADAIFEKADVTTKQTV